MKLRLITTLLILCSVLMGCESDNYEDVRDYFGKNKIGNGADYGVFKNDSDYVITIHGFDNDLDVCLEIAAMLNITQPNTYSCKPLNH